MADIALQAKATQNAPLDYTVPGGQEILLKTMRATYDGTGAAGSFVPAIILRDPFGNEAGCYDLGTTLAIGGTADATWFPGVKGIASSELHWGTNTDPIGNGLTLTTPSQYSINSTGSGMFVNLNSGATWNLGTLFNVNATTSINLVALLSMTLQAGSNLNLRAANGGSGNLFMHLPTADPGVSGATWNNAGVVTVSP